MSIPSSGRPGVPPLRALSLLSVLVAACPSGKETAEPDTGGPGGLQALGHAPDLGPVTDWGGDEEMATGTTPTGLKWLVVNLEGEAGDAVIVVWPDAGQARYDEGAPVLSMVLGGLSGMGACEDSPLMPLTGATGVVAVQVVGPGQCCAGICSAASDDLGGAAFRNTIRSGFQFALGRRRTRGGRVLADLLDVPILQDHGAQLASSCSGVVTLQSMAEDPAAWEGLEAFSIFETPVFPGAMTGALGLRSMDTDDSVDGDGNGLLWDDGRNPRYILGDCAGADCALDLSQLAWDPTFAVMDIRGSFGDPNLDAEGMFFLDGNGNGKLDIVRDTPDIDGDDWVEPTEDFAFLGVWDFASGDDVYYHPTVLFEEALARGLFTDATWPSHMHTAAEAEAFWADRTGLPVVPAVMAAFPDLLWEVNASWADHGVDQPTRPHVVALYQVVRDAGGVVKFNPSYEAMEEVVGTLTTPYTPLELGAELTEENVVDYVTPVRIDPPESRTAGALDLVDWVWGR